MSRSRRNRAGFVFLALALGLAGGIAPPRSASADAEIAPVPDVVGKSAADAKAALAGAGFLPAVFEVAGSPPDTVAAQSPAAGRSLPVGASVIVDVRRASATPTKAPNAVSLSPAEASAAFGALYVLDFVPRPGTAGPVGTIVDQSPRMGEAIDLRGRLTLGFVPDPSLPPRVAVPDATGLSPADAIKAFAAAGLHARVAQATVPGAPADLVIGQTPVPGTEADRYSTVDVVVTATATGAPEAPAPTPVPVPTLVGLTESSARAALSDAGLSAEVEWVDGDASNAFLVQSHDPAAGAPVPPGTTVHVRIVRYVPPPAPALPPDAPAKVAVPALLGMTAWQAEDLLASLGLLSNPILVENPSVPALRVFAQQIVAGTWVDPGTWISFRVSSPAAPTWPVPVPNFYGRSKSAALILAALSGLPLDVLYVSDPTKPAHRVFSQSVAAWSVVPVGTHVTVWISTHPSGPALVPAPDLTGKTAGQASTLLAAAGLVGAQVDVLSPSHPPLRVFAQSPAAGALLPSGGTVTFEVARLGPFSRGVPNLVGRTAAEATAALAALGFASSVTEEIAPGKPVGRVFSQLPPAGSLRLVGAVVALKVAKAFATTRPVPNVLGMTKADAVAALSAQGFSADPDDVLAPTRPLGRVYDQMPAGGSTAPLGATVRILVARGFLVLATVPDVVGMTADQAQTAVTTAGLSPVVERVFAPFRPPGRAFSQDPPAGTRAITGSRVTIQVAGLIGPSRVVPSLLGMTRPEALAALAALGLSGNPSERFCLSCPVGRVLDQDPVAGTSVPAGSSVAFNVAIGLVTPVYTTVPHVLGMTPESARAAIEARGLVSDGETVFRFGEPLHRVWHQSVAGGTLVPRGTAVRWKANP